MYSGLDFSISYKRITHHMIYCFELICMSIVAAEWFMRGNYSIIPTVSKSQQQNNGLPWQRLTRLDKSCWGKKSSLDRKHNSHLHDTSAESAELVFNTPCSLNWGAELLHQVQHDTSFRYPEGSNVLSVLLYSAFPIFSSSFSSHPLTPLPPKKPSLHFAPSSQKVNSGTALVVWNVIKIKHFF